MAIFKRLSKEQITTMFTDKALFCGVVPVYLNLRNAESPDVAVRNWVPEWAMDAMQLIIDSYHWVRQKLNPNYVAVAGFVLTGPIEGAEE
ncbi:hypothetical protein KOEU_38930 [Komagataeibacter europaeus]|uniref:Uncharacterized protein n=1 Tax=Komagataeibacter europaeus TaxID=33995 RepID=A0A0M0EBK7_KOMEU|nr:hypothetical protein [Komagataeibacter europaeus]KON62620.1 hypothetical protein KOEU_38930 [Komagataeibacter europaeus]